LIRNIITEINLQIKLTIRHLCCNTFPNMTAVAGESELGKNLYWTHILL